MEDDRVQACVCLRGCPLLAVTRDRARTNRAPGRGTHLGVKVFCVRRDAREELCADCCLFSLLRVMERDCAGFMAAVMYSLRV